MVQMTWQTFELLGRQSYCTYMNFRFFGLAILLIAAFSLRIFDIAQATEFLGDQGKYGIAAYTAITTSTLPLVGPTTHQGQHLGPFYYYLSIILFGLGQFNPLVPIVSLATLGVVTTFVVYWQLKSLFGTFPAWITALLWAVSPEIIKLNKVLWEPNLIPFFGLLFLVSFYRIYQTEKTRYWILLGMSLGILLQLHYFSLFFLPLSIVVFGVALMKKDSKKPHRTVLLNFILSYFVMMLCMSPWLLYQQTHGWKDLLSITDLIFAQSNSIRVRLAISDALDYGGRMIGYLLPIGGDALTRPRTAVFLIIASVIALASRQSRLWIIVGISWFITGIAAVALYHDVVYNHYLLFLLPAVLLILGGILSTFRAWQSKVILLLFVYLIVTSQIALTRRAPKPNDLARTQSLAETVLSQIGTDPFAFTVIGSSSFSDLHYRFFFVTQGKTPKPITENTYSKLFIICENALCPDSLPGPVPILCYEALCHNPYGEISLANWKSESIYRSTTGSVYLFTSSLPLPHPI